MTFTLKRVQNSAYSASSLLLIRPIPKSWLPVIGSFAAWWRQKNGRIFFLKNMPRYYP